jgi:small-conductance mechanosensitive channel
MRRHSIIITIWFVVLCVVQPGITDTSPSPGQDSVTLHNSNGTDADPSAKDPTAADQTAKKQSSLKMLNSILDAKAGLSVRIEEKNRQLVQSESATQKELLKSELERLDKQVNDYSIDFERIATGVDIGLFAEKKSEQFDWQSELVGLVEPGIKEIKRMTVRARYKTKLKDERSRYQDLLPVAEQAVENIEVLIEKSTDPQLKQSLQTLLPEWQGVEKQIKNKMEIVSMRLTEMENEEKSFIETSKNSIKNFFRTRGLFLFIAVVSCIAVILLMKLAARTFVKFIPGYTAKYRPFHVRALTLIFRVLSVFLVLFVLIFVFYIVEDWVLLSLTIIFVMGLGWAVKHTLPSYWHQSRLMLNIGAVREGERMMYQGVPWLVKKINPFTELENPSLGIKLRLPIEELMDKTSRPFHRKEPWFPCKRNDWVVLSDGSWGTIASLSHEMVEIIQRGGARVTYLTPDFLALSPLNISMNFRLKTTFGISYDLQSQSTTHILETMQTFVKTQIEKEGYHDSLLNIRVEFESAGASSLDLVVITDFKGEQAHLYRRLSRAVQRWCVDACTENNWEIPFPQLTVHKPSIQDQE